MTLDHIATNRIKGVLVKRSWLEFYALVVCFFTVAYLCIVVALAIWNGVATLAPEFAMDRHEWARHQSNQAFLQANPQVRMAIDGNAIPLTPEPAQTEADRARSYALAVEGTRREAARSLVRHLVALLVASVLFAVHWRIARSARERG